MNHKPEDSDKKPVEVEIFQMVAIIRFVRSESKNPLSIRTLQILEKAFCQINGNPKVKVVIFTGKGNAFAAGANLKEVAALTAETAAKFGLRGQKLMQKIYNSRKHTIAAVNGFCMGGALDLALSCRERIASPESVFAHPGASLGIITGWGGTQLLPRLVGKKNAFEIFLTAKRIGADEALRIGLIDEIAPNPLAKAMSKISR